MQQQTNTRMISKEFADDSTWQRLRQIFQTILEDPDPQQNCFFSFEEVHRLCYKMVRDDFGGLLMLLMVSFAIAT